MKYSISLAIGVAALAGWLALSAPAATDGDSSAVKAFVGARIIDGTGKPPMQNATLVVRNGRVEAVGPSVNVPAGAQRIDAAGKTIIPGMINAHGHLEDASQLALYARYGITTVFSLSGDKELAIRDKVSREQWSPTLTHARLYIAGPAVASKTPAEARKAVDDLAAAKVDIVKFRLDDQLGKGMKMPPAVYTAIIDEAKKKGMRVAVHVVYLADAKAVLKLGADYIAHSVRDFEIDDETIALLKKNNVFYCPTLTREVAMFTYAEKPAFLKDAFFLKDADREQLAKVQETAFQQTMRTDSSANWYKDHLPLAMRNLKKAEDAGVPVVMGTDSGAVYRFQGFFEHLELEYMAKAGLTPMQILVSATGTAARALKANDQIGTLEPGKWADLAMLNANPLDDIRNTQKIDSVWIAGNRVPGK
jgi:imidazolonepropionase-like amidohydrolase